MQGMRKGILFVISPKWEHCERRKYATPLIWGAIDKMFFGFAIF